VPPPTSITVPAPSMLSTRSAKSRGNETRATTVATAATAAGSVRRWPNVRMLGDIVPLLTVYLLRLQVVYSSRSIEIYDGLYPAYGVLV